MYSVRSAAPQLLTWAVGPASMGSSSARAGILTGSWSLDSVSAPERLVAIEFSSVAVERARRFSGYDEVLAAVAQLLPLGDRSVDTALSVECLEHLVPLEVKRAIAELARIARRRVVISTPTPALAVNVAWLTGEIEEAAADPEPLGREEALVLGACVHKSSLAPEQLAAAGFQALTHETGELALLGDSHIDLGRPGRDRR